ncbi:MAG TPA: hypothetical protein VN554_02940 [Verrucomicrobiae bacterium]|nr:hypothetical protein [Verrucomicrobiae bacterium]
MQIPQMSPTAAVLRVSGLDATLHEVAGVNWHVLLPYTALGGGLMVYSQVRLLRGQHVLKRQLVAQPAKKRSRRGRFLLFRLRSDVGVVVN